jgi:hypothetical protein
MVTRGYPSLSFVRSAAEALAAQGRPAWLYYFGDHDPSGRDIPRFVEENVRAIAPAADFTLEVVAATGEQIEAWKLPTRPTKPSDTRSRRYTGPSVEVDAIPPATLRSLVREAVERHLDHGELDRLRMIEVVEREALLEVAANWNGEAA